MIGDGTYGGGLGGPSIRGDHRTLSREDALKRLADLRAGRKPTLITPDKPGVVTPPTKPTTGKPKPKPKKKSLEGALDSVYSIPKMQVPTLITPDLDVTPTLQTATLKDFAVTPIEIGAPPTLEAAPEASPVTRMPDRQDASMRQAKLNAIAKMKQAKGYGATLLSGGAGDLRRVATRKGA